MTLYQECMTCSPGGVYQTAQGFPDQCPACASTGFVPVEPTHLLTQLEAAPVIVNPDGDGGYIVTPIEDDVLLAVANEMSDDNNWLPTERDNLYEALCDAISRIGEPT